MGGPVVPPGENGPTTEIFDPDTKTIKKMSSLPPPGRTGHSLDSNLACGGDGPGSWSTCDMWNGREWERAGVTLNHYRSGHVSWPRHDGVLLMCGGSEKDGKTTELVTWDGKRSTVSFSLEYHLK